MNTTVTITIPEGQADDLRHLLIALQAEKEQILYYNPEPVQEEKREQLEAELALIEITIESLNDAHHNH